MWLAATPIVTLMLLTSKARSSQHVCYSVSTMEIAFAYFVSVTLESNTTSDYTFHLIWGIKMQVSIKEVAFLLSGRFSIKILSSKLT